MTIENITIIDSQTYTIYVFTIYCKFETNLINLRKYIYIYIYIFIYILFFAIIIAKK